MRLRHAALLLVLLFPVFARASETPAEHMANAYASQEMAAAPRNGNLPDYALPPDKLTKAQHLQTLRVALHLTAAAWGIAQLCLLLWLGTIAWMRDRALALSRNRWIQGFSFLLMLFLARFALNLPLSLYGHHLSLDYGFSIQRWPSWCLDVAKSFTLNWLLYGCILMLLFALIRHAPRRWWVWLSFASIPLTLAGAMLYPVVIDPLFNQFEPLSLHHPELVADLARMNVPADHTFLMKASAKVTTPNAYVIGFGPTKRLVVWDTELAADAKSPTGRAELLWILGHESGHYALNHVRNGTLLALAGLPLVLYLAYLALNWTLARFGPAWRISSQTDWAAAAVLLLLLAIGSILSEPIVNTISRHIEHNADIYGQEAIHGLVPDPQSTVAAAATTMGTSILDDPNPNPLIEFWLDNHPSTGRRAAFGKAYNPWAPGMQTKYFPQ